MSTQLAALTLYWVDTYTLYMYETKRSTYTACISLIVLNTTENTFFLPFNITHDQLNLN